MRKIPSIEELGLPMSTFLLLMHAGRHLHHRLDNAGGYGDLTPSQFYSLMILDEMKSLPLSKISERIRRSPGNMTLVIDNLEKEGFVERHRSTEDRRVILISLTDLGCEKIEAARKTHVAAVKQELGVLTEDEVKTLRSLLLKLQPKLNEPDCDENQHHTENK